MVKALVYKGPRGHNLVAEGDYLYPLPDSVASLKPKRTKLKAVPAPPAPPPPPPPIEAPHPDYSIDDEENHILFNHEYEQQHPDLYVPDSGWRNDPNLAQLVDVPEGKEVPETAAKERIWSQQQQQTTVTQLGRIILLQNDNISLLVQYCSTSIRNSSSSSRTECP